MTKKLALAAQADCCTTISTLLQSGFRLGDALDFIGVQFPKLKARVTGVQDDLADGTMIDTAFARGGFSPVVCTQIGLAGAHGDLDGALAEVAQYLKLLQNSRSKVWQLLAYPLTLLALLTVMQFGIVYWVLPQLSADPDQAMGPQLFICLSFVLTVLLITVFVKGMTPQKRYDVLHRVPVIGRILTEYYQYEFMIGAASFLGVGRDLGTYCAYLAEQAPGPLTQVGRRVTNELLTGVSLQTALKDDLVPASLVHLMAMGQEPRLFAQSTATLARGLFKNLELRMNRLLAFVQPLMFLILGVQIVVMYAHLLLPLYSVVERY